MTDKNWQKVIDAIREILSEKKKKGGVLGSPEKTALHIRESES